MIKKLTNILKPNQPYPQPKMSINLLTTSSKPKKSQKKQAETEKLKYGKTPKLYGLPKLHKEKIPIKQLLFHSLTYLQIS